MRVFTVTVFCVFFSGSLSRSNSFIFVYVINYTLKKKDIPKLTLLTVSDSFQKTNLLP